VRLYSFCTSGRHQRVGLQIGDDELVDITDAYERLLECEGNPKARGLANVWAPPDMVGFLAGGEKSLDVAKQIMDFARSERASRGTEKSHKNRFHKSISSLSMLAPIPCPPKIIGIAVNNKSLAGQLSAGVLAHPLLFLKQSQAVIGPGSPVCVPDVGIVHQEIELALIINKLAKNIDRKDALSCVAGYMIINDVTAADLRDKEERIPKLQLSYTGRYKNYDTFGPCGPCIVTKDEVTDPGSLRIEGRLAGETVQLGNTKDYQFPVDEIIEWVSHIQTLIPGTIIACGTVGFVTKNGWKDCDLRKRAGEQVEGEIEHLGLLKNPIKAV
jgi:acylpyruvate hydrolase